MPDKRPRNELGRYLVLAQAGCSLSRDSVDRRIINEIRTGTATYGERYGGGVRVEREARLAASRQSSDDDKPIAWKRDVHVLEVMFARSANDELVLRHPRSLADPQSIEQVFRFSLSISAPLGRMQPKAPAEQGSERTGPA